jgi:hypothetical protein
MKKFFQTIWFPIGLFVVLEAICFLAGSLMTWQAACMPCPSAADYCPPCPSGNYGLSALEMGIIPSAAVAIALFVYVRAKLKKGADQGRQQGGILEG